MVLEEQREEVEKFKLTPLRAPMSEAAALDREAGTMELIVSVEKSVTWISERKEEPMVMEKETK